jgi:hypothetical protein
MIQFGIVGNDSAIAKLHKIISNNIYNRNIIVVWDFDCTLSYNHTFKLKAIVEYTEKKTDYIAHFTRYMESARKYLLAYTPHKKKMGP